MHISQQRFDLDRADKSGVQAFLKHVWYSSEVCSNCFTQVRSVGDVVRKSMDDHTHELPAYYERTEDASQEYTPFGEPSDRYGTCFCDNCGADTQPQHRDLPWERMREYALHLYEFADSETPLTLSRERFARHLAHLRLDRRDTAGRESQVFAVAFARALETDVTTNGTVRGRQADDDLALAD